MPRPPADWIAQLPRERLLAEYSLGSADLIHLADELARIADHADILHVDIADGHFAPVLSFFPDFVARIREATALPIHVHLLIDDRQLLSQIDQVAAAGADLISIHLENGAAADAALARLAELGVPAGLVLKVDTPVEAVAPYLDRIAFLTLLCTAIGPDAQELDPRAESRLQEADALIAKSARNIVLAAEGGIHDHTVPLLRAAGTETVVMGSLAFGAPDLVERMKWLHAL